MIKLIFTVLVFFTIMVNSTFSEIIKSFEVIGNERITKETIKVYSDIKIGSDYQADDINEIVKTLYSTEFFENINAKFENNKLTLIVKEWNRHFNQSPIHYDSNSESDEIDQYYQDEIYLNNLSSNIFY